MLCSRLQADDGNGKSSFRRCCRLGGGKEKDEDKSSLA